MHILLIFIDGIGLGENDLANNPFAVANTPTLNMLAGNQRWLRATPYTEADRSIFIPTDTRFGVEGRPQSASGQAVILTGRNVPAEIGEHYGPKPNPAIRAILAENNLFKELTSKGKTAAFLDAYPPGFFKGIDSGRRLRSSMVARRAAACVCSAERRIGSEQVGATSWAILMPRCIHPRKRVQNWPN